MVENKVLQLTEMSVNELKNLWRQYFDTEPIWKTKRFYIPRLAYRMQELVYGGVPENVKNILLGKTIQREFNNKKMDGLPKVGTKLVKTYQVEKTGKIAIYRDYNKKTITLITCTHDDLTKKSIYIFEQTNE